MQSVAAAWTAGCGWELTWTLERGVDVGAGAVGLRGAAVGAVVRGLTVAAWWVARLVAVAGWRVAGAVVSCTRGVWAVAGAVVACTGAWSVAEGIVSCTVGAIGADVLVTSITAAFVAPATPVSTPTVCSACGDA